MGIVAKENNPKPARAVVFVHCDEDATLDHLTREGVTINQNRGRVRTGIIPFKSLEVFSKEHEVKKIIPSHYVKPQMEVARGSVGFPLFQNRTNLRGKRSRNRYY